MRQGSVLQVNDELLDDCVRAVRALSEAQAAEIPYVTFKSRPKAKHISARLIVRRVKDMNPDHQSELFTAYRYHAVFTNSPPPWWKPIHRC